MYTGIFANTYSIIFWMEMDAVPVKSGWLDKFVEESTEMWRENIAIRGSGYRGVLRDDDKKLPSYQLEHINGNAIYNLQHPWTQFLFAIFSAGASGATATMPGMEALEGLPFDVAFALMTELGMQDAVRFRSSKWADAWKKNNCTSATYSYNTSLIGNYGSSLLSKGFKVGTYIRHGGHGSDANLFDDLAADMVTLGVLAYDASIDVFLQSVSAKHPFGQPCQSA